MDDPGLDPAAHRAALRGLARLNTLSGADRTLARAIAHHPSLEGSSRPLRILDVAVGSGDVPLRLCRRLVARGLDVALTGVDISELAVEACQARAARDAPSLPAQFVAMDVLRDPLPDADVVTCSLFVHHLTNPNITILLGAMAKAAGRLVVVSDLERSRAGLATAWAASRMFTRSHVVHTDAVLSVRAALTPSELKLHADNAGMTGASIQQVFPCRMLLTWSPTRNPTKRPERRQNA